MQAKKIVHLLTFSRKIKTENSREIMILRPLFQPTRDENLETCDQATKLQVIRAALKFAANRNYQHYKKNKKASRYQLAL